ncbi:hypothetical protein N9N28_00405 [Rubripirellula amarantea]|uniref:Thioredoxin domain-containing protein n=1 Tax=Rubripirellula amarantea TaxID=2527999 RepID=A0A5C5WRZ6_9BACT|nr:hypothetical protein [Rubripirellula amarantea]MDA8743065.1 hypothetical protein [Rubripirellula amarantea]TWT53586.1 hypothetical protein Pla22_12150 [Rubripirellula amarantea]
MPRSKPFLFAMSVIVLLTSFDTSFWTNSSNAAEAKAASNSSAKGLQAGDPLGAFRVIKVAGAVDDTIEPGDTLCYRCRYGSSPMVLVFARKPSDGLVNLAKQLDQSLRKNSDEKLKGLVTFLGDEVPTLKEHAASLAGELGETLLPIVVAEDSKTGPLEYQLSSSDAVTVIIAQDSQVVGTLVFSEDSIDAKKVVDSIKAMLSEPN